MQSKILFPKQETKKNQDDMIARGEPYVEALEKRAVVKKYSTMEILCVTYFRFSVCGCDLFSYLITMYTVCI